MYLRYIVLFVIVLSFLGCSTRFVHEQKSAASKPVSKKEKSSFIPFKEPEIVVYKEDVKPKILPPKSKKLTKAQIKYNKRVAYVREKAAPHWGKKAKVADRYNYVKYANDFKARTVIDFENSIVKVETTDAQNPIKTLEEVIASSLLNPRDLHSLVYRYFYLAYRNFIVF